jgi:hypothetical protein
MDPFIRTEGATNETVLLICIPTAGLRALHRIVKTREIHAVDTPDSDSHRASGFYSLWAHDDHKDLLERDFDFLLTAWIHDKEKVVLTQ